MGIRQSIYPEWSQLKNNLDLLPSLMLKKLRTTMCFITLDKGKQRVAIIVRVPSSEFPFSIETTLMRLHVGICQTKYADMFFFYIIVADAKNLWWTETWIFPYDDPLIGPSIEDSLALEARKRLNLLLSQEYSYALIIDENNKLRCVRKISLTMSQKKLLPKLVDVLKEYEGKKLTLSQAKNVIDDYLANIDRGFLQQQFEVLLREK